MNLDNLQTKKDISLDQDRVGGAGILPTDVYSATVKYAYLSTAKSGAYALNVQFDIDGKAVTQQFWMTSGTAKGGTNTYKDKNGKEQYLPGFVMGNTLALLTSGQEIGSLTPEEKVLSLYNYEEKKELPTEVPVYVDIIGKEVKVAIEEQIVDKNVKNDQGVYVASGETRKQNEAVKFFRTRDDMTVTEIQNKADEAAFMQVWLDKNKGSVNDKSTGTSANGATPGAPNAAAKAQPTRSLFN